MLPFRHAFKAMACMAEIQVYADDPKTARSACHAAQREVERIEAKYSRYRDDSVTSAINRGAGGDPVAVDAETSGLLDYADACWKQSDGLFDITSGVLRRVWDFKSGVPPSDSAIADVLEHIGWQRVRRDAAGIALAPGMEIDFGGIGKEYAADRAAAALSAAGLVHGLVNLGGDIRAIGPHPGGKPWRVGIVHPREANRTIASVSVTEGGLATSGDYERFFIHEGRRYSHILDPRTGWPVAGAQSVSVIAPLCVVAGTCATIAMLRGDHAEDYLREQGLAYLIVDRNGRLAGTLTGVSALLSK
jgi:thiamine biosynthesis lipoprotein